MVGNTSLRTSRLATVLIIASTCSLMTPLVRAAIVPVLDLTSLVSKSDRVVVARISVNDLSSPSSLAIELDVLATLKGDRTQSKLSLTISTSGIIGNWGPSRDGSARIVFLKYHDGQLTAADPIYPSLPAVTGFLPQSLDPLGEVFEEEGAVLGSLSSSSSEKEEALNVLGTCKDPRSTNALRAGLTDRSATVRLETISRLALLGDPDGISNAIDALSAPQSSLPDYVIHNLNVGIRDGARSETVVPKLSGLLSAANPETREAAAESLMQIASPSSAAALFRALWDDDKKVRYFAVVGLAKIKGDRDHRPNLEQFHNDEVLYTSYWRQQQ